MNVLIVYHSEKGATKKLACEIAQGVEEVDGIQCVLKSVFEASVDDVIHTDGLILGSSVRYGSMSGEMKLFVEKFADKAIFFNGKLINKVGAAFCSSGAKNSGKEFTLLSLLLPLIHHGFYIVGVPERETIFGGSCYGATYTSGPGAKLDPSKDDIDVANLLGRRVAELVVKVNSDENLIPIKRSKRNPKKTIPKI